MMLSVTKTSYRFKCKRDVLSPRKESVLSTALWYSPIFRCSSNRITESQYKPEEQHQTLFWLPKPQKSFLVSVAWSIKQQTGLTGLSLVRVQGFSKSTEVPYSSLQATNRLLATAETLNFKGLCICYACLKI